MKKLTTLNREICQEHAKSNLAQNSNVPRSQEDYINQNSEEIEGRVTKKLPLEFSRTKNCILGALSRLDYFLMNPLIQGHTGTTPETFRNAYDPRDQIWTTPRVIHILKPSSCRGRRRKTLAQKMATTAPFEAYGRRECGF